MADNKFDKQLDRQAVLFDFKNRIIDLMENGFVAPEVDIYDEPVRYLKMNEQWFKIFAGWLSWMESVAFWKEATGEDYRGIQAILKFEEGIELPAPTFPEGDDCANYPLSSIFIDYEPQDPFNNPEYIPPDYLMPPFMLNDDLEYPEIMGYQATDVFVPFGAVTIDPIDLATFNLPRLILSVKGSGQIELDFLAVAFGGVVVTKVGTMPNITDIILDNIFDTGIQVIDLEVPTGTVAHAGNVVKSTEINIEAEPEEITKIYIVFAPKVNDSIIPIAFGGGIRAVQLCAVEGEGSVVGLEAIRFNEETCSFEQRIGGEWEVIEGNEYIAACLGGGMSVEEICEGVICAMEQAASRFLAGVAGNLEGGVVINPDGSIEIGGDSGLPPDDPATGIDETESARYGASIQIGEKIELFLQKIDDYYGTDATADTPAADTKLAIKYYFPTDPTILDAAIDNYYAWRAVPNGKITFTASAAFYQYLYCNGNGEFAVTRYFFDLSGFSLTKINIINGLIVGLSEQFFEDNFEIGAKVPSNGYTDAACYPMPPQSFTDIPYNSSRTLSPSIAKGGHRLKIKVSGYYEDNVDNDVHDAFWHRTPAGVLTRTNFTFSHAAGANMPSDNQVPYNSSHIYEYTIDLATGNSSWSVNFPRPASMSAGSTSPTNGFDIEIVDLGLAVSQ